MKNKKLRVAAIFEIPTPYRDPVLELVGRRDALDCDVYFLSSSQRDRHWDRKPTSSLKARTLGGFQYCLYGSHTFYLNFGLGELLERGKYDAYVIGGYSQLAMIRVLRHCWRVGSPYVMVTESHLGKNRSALLRWMKDSFVRNVYTRSKANLVTSTAAKRYVLHYGAPKDSTFLFPNSVDGPSYAEAVDRFRSSRVETLKAHGLSSGRCILFVGALIRRKGVDLLLESFSRVAKKNTDLSLLLVGEGAERKFLERRIHEEGIEARVAITGFVQPDLLPKYYACADLFVLPSLDEPFGAVVCEAGAAGLPLVVSKAVGAAEDFLENSVSGRLIESGSAESLDEALLDFSENEAKWKAYGERSREIMLKWSHARMAENFFQSIEVALRQGGKG